MAESSFACSKGTIGVGGENAETELAAHPICGRLTLLPNIKFKLTCRTSRISHQSSPVCAHRKLAGFADKSTSVAPTQTQTRNTTDKYGAVQANYSYDVFGNPYLSNLDHDIGFGYCGKVYDNGTGLYNYGFRDYSPNQARFTTVDPIRDGANWFSYVVNDPVNYIDPFGLYVINNTDQWILIKPENADGFISLAHIQNTTGKMFRDLNMIVKKR